MSLLSSLMAFGSGPDTKTVRGPLTVETRFRRIGAGGFPNTTANPFKRTTVTEFAVAADGKALTVEDEGQRLSAYWEAKVLTGAKTPAVLAAIRGTYLFTVDGSGAKAQVLVPGSSDFATWQWLDAKDGQPG